METADTGRSQGLRSKYWATEIQNVRKWGGNYFIFICLILSHQILKKADFVPPHTTSRIRSESAHLVHVENEIQLAHVFEAFIQRFHKHLQQIWTVKHFIPPQAAQTFHISLSGLL